MAKNNPITNAQGNKIIDNLDAIKKLIVLSLLKKGKLTSDAIGNVLGLEGSTIRHMVRTGSQMHKKKTYAKKKARPKTTKKNK